MSEDARKLIDEFARVSWFGTHCRRCHAFDEAHRDRCWCAPCHRAVLSELSARLSLPVGRAVGRHHVPVRASGRTPGPGPVHLVAGREAEQCYVQPGARP